MAGSGIPVYKYTWKEKPILPKMPPQIHEKYRNLENQGILLKAQFWRHNTVYSI